LTVTRFWYGDLVTEPPTFSHGQCLGEPEPALGAVGSGLRGEGRHEHPFPPGEDKPMHLASVTIRNFRMHLDTTVSFDASTTVVVGRNNSGKTSVAELFRKFFGDGPGRSKGEFTLDDFSSATHEALLEAAKSGQVVDGPRTEPPAIEFELLLDYSDSVDDLAVIADFIVDLDDACTSTKVLLRYTRATGPRGEPFFAPIPADPDGALRALDERVRKTFEITVVAVDPTDPLNSAERSLSDLSECVQLGFINAARPLDGDKGREPDTLGRTLTTLFEASRKGDEDGAAAMIEQGVADAEKTLNDLFGDHMKGKILPPLSPLGYPLLSDGELLTRTTFDALQLLKQNTRLYYGASSGVGVGRPLPEGHNGLGLRNLIYILLQLHAFHEARKVAIVPPPFCVLFLEEPEAHLHPQLEEIFIRKVGEVHDKLCGESKWPLQIVVTTHSSHIANEVPFEKIRYFLREPSASHVQYKAKVKDLGEFSAEADLKDWLTQYLTLTRCDLFFADKVVLIEGAAERLLLPAFMRKVDEAAGEAEAMLTAQYLTTVEVDGRHAHKFFPLIEFIGIPALVVTDLDAEVQRPAKNGATHDDGTPKLSWQRSLVCLGARTGNPCIKDWFDTDELVSIQARTDSDKVKAGNAPMRIAFQVPETPGQPCGRSFEEALVLANPGRWPAPAGIVGGQTIEEWASGEAENLGKTSLALSLLGRVGEADFVIPKYLREGLEWLREVGAPPEQAASAAPLAAGPLDAAASDETEVAAHGAQTTTGAAHDA